MQEANSTSGKLTVVPLAATAAATAAIATSSAAWKASLSRDVSLNGTPTSDIPNQFAACHFLHQATFGPTDDSIAELIALGFNKWFENQSNQPKTSSLDWVVARDAMPLANIPKSAGDQSKAHFLESFWKDVLVGKDQLRQRIAYALSQIFVVSMRNEDSVSARQVAEYYDMLKTNAFGNFQTLLRYICLSPAMSVFLNISGSYASDGLTNRHPDENFAREIMQLMSIGLFLLNDDGSYILDSHGNPIPTYSQSDVSNLAKVFTGWGWQSTAPTSASFSHPRDNGADIKPLVQYPNYHSLEPKTFLGTTIPAYAGNMNVQDISKYQSAELELALKVIFNHQNVPAFISFRLIQNLVTSNPSRGYVARVASVFKNNGLGVRGDLKATIRAILFDPEAGNVNFQSNVPNKTDADSSYGKLREPVLRMANWARAFEVTSASGRFYPPYYFGYSQEFKNSPFCADTVFNFWSPFFSVPNGEISTRGLYSPEFAQFGDVLSAQYSNMILDAVNNGSWRGSETGDWQGNDVTTEYAKELKLIDKNNKKYIDNISLVDRLDLLFLSGKMSDTLKSYLSILFKSMPRPAATATQSNLKSYNLFTIRNATMIVLTSPEYVIQR